MTQADWDAAVESFIDAKQESVFLVLVGARYEDGGHVLSTEDARALTVRVMASLSDREAQR